MRRTNNLFWQNKPKWNLNKFPKSYGSHFTRSASLHHDGFGHAGIGTLRIGRRWKQAWQDSSSVSRPREYRSSIFPREQSWPSMRLWGSHRDLREESVYEGVCVLSEIYPARVSVTSVTFVFKWTENNLNVGFSLKSFCMFKYLSVLCCLATINH